MGTRNYVFQLALMERRIDPADGASYTFKEGLQRFKAEGGVCLEGNISET